MMTNLEVPPTPIPMTTNTDKSHDGGNETNNTIDNVVNGQHQRAVTTSARERKQLSLTSSSSSSSTSQKVGRSPPRKRIAATTMVPKITLATIAASWVSGSASATWDLPPNVELNIINCFSVQFLLQVYCCISKLRAVRQSYYLNNSRYLTFDVPTSITKAPIPATIWLSHRQLHHVLVPVRRIDPVLFFHHDIIDFQRLHPLDLSETQLTNGNWPEFIARIRVRQPHGQLRELYLGWTLSTIVEVIVCCTIIAEHCPLLVHLDLDGCPVTDHAIQPLAAFGALPHLKTLDIDPSHDQPMRWKYQMYPLELPSLAALLDRGNGTGLTTLSMACIDGSQLEVLSHGRYLDSLGIAFILPSSYSKKVKKRPTVKLELPFGIDEVILRLRGATYDD
jgi:hypothetical protein